MLVLDASFWLLTDEVKKEWVGYIGGGQLQGAKCSVTRFAIPDGP